MVQTGPAINFQAFLKNFSISRKKGSDLTDKV